MQYTITGQIWITPNEYIAITPETRTLTEDQAEREYGPRRKTDSPTGTQYRSQPNFAGSRKTRDTVLTPETPAPKVQVTKDGPAYLLPGIEPASKQGGDTEQLAMF